MYSPATMHRLVRRTLTIGTIVGLALAPLHVTNAQSVAPDRAASTRPWSIRFTSGALVPTGAQRDAFSSAQLSAMGLSWRLRPALDITGSVSWARSRAVGVVERPKLDVFTSDLGLELRTNMWSPSDVVRVRPFVGGGAGVRTYNSRATGEDATNHPAGYVAAGGDIELGRVGLRLEARDYASRIPQGPGTGARALRNDVVISASLSVKKRRAPQP